MIKDVEVITSFTENGMVIPRKIRYFDYEDAKYNSKDILSVFNIERRFRSTLFFILY